MALRGIDGQIYHKWCFITTEGPIEAYFTDKEISKMKIESPEINWRD